MAEILLYFLSAIVSLSISMLMLMMMARAIMSWFMPDDSNRLYAFLTAVTEPVILPVRLILDRFELFRDLPIDISFFVTVMLLSVIQLFL